MKFGSFSVTILSALPHHVLLCFTVEAISRLHCCISVISKNQRWLIMMKSVQ